MALGSGFGKGKSDSGGKKGVRNEWNLLERKNEVPESSGRRIETIGLIRFDEIGGKLYAEQRSNLEDVLDSTREQSWKSCVKNNHPNGFKLILPGHKFVFDVENNRLIEKSVPRNIETEIPIDLKIYGLCSSSELRQGKPFEEIAARIHNYFGKWECPIDKDGIALIDLRNEIYRIDTKRGYWPIERKAFFFDTINGKRVAVPDMGQDIKLVEVNGSWVPKSVSVIIDPSHTLSCEFDWVSYDEPLPPKAFDLKEIIEGTKERKRETGGKGQSQNSVVTYAVGTKSF